MQKLIFGICFLLLLSVTVQAQKAKTVRVEVVARTSVSWDGSPLPGYPESRPEITILRIKIPPGVRLSLHHHPVINAGYLVEGELTVVTEDSETLRLKAGDAIVEVVHKGHYGRNDGTKTAELIVFYVGASGVPITVEE